MSTAPREPDAEEERARAAKERVAEALRILEDEGREAFDRFVDARPDLAAEVRRRVRELSRLGLLAGGGDADAGDDTGRRIGPYRLIERIGTGGMGVVHLAEHVRLGRRVALKTLPARVPPGPRARERFLRECRVVAQLDHPGIVPVFEVGEQDGVPWFAMQYVPGRTLADLIAALARSGVPAGELRSVHLARVLRGEPVDAPDAGNAAPRGKTYVETVCRLIHDVAEALEHAHAHGVLHRDVKPSNVLVAPDGRARLFDFGLADLEDELPLTLTREFVGTPHYVSPEQISDRKNELDARTDVYSLGVTLFELLTLRPPFEGRTTQQVLRQIQTREPPAPRKLNPLVPRDLETICLTAMEKSRDRRYASAADLAADLRRFLELRPIVARPIGAVTRAFRLARRNRAATVAAALGALLVVGAPVALVLVNVRIQRERDAAERAFSFLERVVFESDVEEAGAGASLSEVIGRAGDRVLEELTGAPEARARLLTRIGAYFSVSGELDRAARYLEEARAAWTTLRGEDDPETAAATNHLANVRRAQGRPAEAAELFRAAAASFEAARGEQDDDVVMVLGNLAELQAEHGRDEEAEALLDRVERIARGRDPADEETLSRTLVRRARLRYRQGRADEAAALYRDAIDRLEAAGESSKLLADAWAGWARLRLEADHLDDAEEGFSRQRETYAAMFGEDSYQAATSTIFLGEVAARRGELDEAARRIADGVDRYVAELGARHPWTLDHRSMLVEILRRGGRLDEAETRRRALLEDAAASAGATSGRVQWLTLQEAFLLELHGDRAAAEERVDEAVRLAREDAAGDPGALARALDWLRAICDAEGFEELGERVAAAGE